MQILPDSKDIEENPITRSLMLQGNYIDTILVRNFRLNLKYNSIIIFIHSIKNFKRQLKIIEDFLIVSFTIHPEISKFK